MLLDKSTGLTDCSVSNGGCGQNCTDLPAGGFYCSCRDGFNISTSDRKSCDGQYIV